MADCATCGMDYSGSFTVKMSGVSQDFCCFECAISALAPDCAHCGCKVIGKGHEVGHKIYCCSHCATHRGEQGFPSTARAGTA